MTCPKCGGQMRAVVHEGVEIDRCAACGGIWFDAMEDRELRRREGAEAVDDGDPAVGRTFDAVGAIQCPRDGTRMVQMVDLEQPHVWVESCPTCFGTFLDAGEFTDLHEYTLVERVVRPRRPRLP